MSDYEIIMIVLTVLIALFTALGAFRKETLNGEPPAVGAADGSFS